ncbi:MAG: hypothetical protein JXL84_07240 [Deltaproteobacteria bacterium]|nr:hypothetical protein [Deltaproteobacteria bacterium]
MEIEVMFIWVKPVFSCFHVRPPSPLEKTPFEEPPGYRVPEFPGSDVHRVQVITVTGQAGDVGKNVLPVQSDSAHTSVARLVNTYTLPR